MMASRQFKRWKKASGLSLQQIADQIGCHPGALWYWMNGKRVPQVGAALAIQRLTGIAVEAWSKAKAA
jgi:transcriptional regulator with XRE-family HTH domain